jgi:3-phosphoshikimate 1-carboxyvinyltransferase
MTVRIEPGIISGVVSSPSSKSMTQRAYAAALLHDGKTVIHHAGHSEDELAALQVLQQLGARVVSQTNTSIEIVSEGIKPLTNRINCGESGLSARLFTPIAALSSEVMTIEGRGSLLRRPVNEMKDILDQLNVRLPGFNGFLPVTIVGPLKAASIKINASEGSQFLSGLLFALSSCATQPIIIEVAGLKSKPYIDLTLEVLQHFGKPITHNHYRQFYIDPALFVAKDYVEINMEGDWSSASYFLVAGAIAGNATVQNLLVTSRQADRVLVDVLRSAGAELTFDEDIVSVKKAHLRAFDFDATHCPDLFPVLAVLAACCNGESSILGVHRLFHKESNRVESITEMLHDFAVPWSVEDDRLFINGVAQLQGTVIDSYRDHRIVMAAAIGALRANGPVDISFAESVNKSYPDFFKDLILCGGRCTFNNDL